VDALKTKATIVEVVIVGLFLWIFPIFTLVTIGIIVGLKFANERYFKSDSSQAIVKEKISMRAALYDVNGIEHTKIHTIPIPKFGRSDILVQVHGASLNPVDYKFVTPLIPFVRWLKPHTVGRDFSGKIIDIGSAVQNFKIGEEVYGNAYGGSLQEFTVVSPNDISKKPANMTDAEAASVALAGLTSYQALHYWKKLSANDKVLIIGASGGTGSLAVQIAKSFGAKVFGVCSAKNVHFVQSLGCDHVIDYTNPNYLDEVKNEQFDIIFDCVTSPDDPDQEAIFGKFMKADGGKYVAINGKPLDFMKGILAQRFGVSLEKENFHLLSLSWNTKDLESLAQLIEAGHVKVHLQEEVLLTDESIVKTFDALKSRRVTGKIGFNIMRSSTENVSVFPK